LSIDEIWALLPNGIAGFGYGAINMSGLAGGKRPAEKEWWGLRFHVIPSQGFTIGLFKEEKEWRKRA
jgi:hypothetical protein